VRHRCKRKKRLSLAEKKNSTHLQTQQQTVDELDSMKFKKFENPQFGYIISRFHTVLLFAVWWWNESSWRNNHTGSKPFSYADVNKYWQLKEENCIGKLRRVGSKKQVEWKFGWSSRRRLPTPNPILDLHLGKSADPSVVIPSLIPEEYSSMADWAKNCKFHYNHLWKSVAAHENAIKTPTTFLTIR
jgi:hypothetical protein